MKRILVVHHPGNAFSNPTLQSFIQYAIANSIEIDIRCRTSMALKPKIENLTWLKYGKIIKLLKKYFLKNLSVKTVIWIISLYEVLFVFKKQYDLIIGIDKEGLIDAGHYSAFLRIPYVYFSFEIMFSDEIGEDKKRIEKEFSKNVNLWLVQDEVRANCLVEENNLSLDNSFICPVASAGLGEFSKSRLRDRLDIDVKKKVAIMIGSLSDWSMSYEIIKSVEKWPEDWVLIVHERYGRAYQIIKDRIGAKYLGTRIVPSNFSSENLDDMGTILSGIEVGLAFYNPVYTTPYNGKNLKYLGLSSGKIATYLRYGIPILTNYIGKYADLIKKNKLGLVLENPEKIAFVLENMCKSEYSDNCQSFFLKNLDANIYMPLLLNKLDTVSRQFQRT